MAEKRADDRSLKRLGGGRWQTRDERFTIEPQSGTWVIVDAEQTDDLGLPLVRGPFRSLTDAKEAVEAARGTPAPESPLADRVKQAGTGPRKEAGPRDGAQKTDGREAGARAPGKAKTAPEAAAAPEPQPPPEPRWIGDLGPRDRGRARRLIEQLRAAGVRDAEGVVRQDLTGGVPTIARLALADRLAASLPAADVAPAIERAIAPLIEALTEGRDDNLDVRWRLVDGDERPIGLTTADLRAATKRRADAAEKENER